MAGKNVESSVNRLRKRGERHGGKRLPRFYLGCSENTDLNAHVNITVEAKSNERLFIEYFVDSREQNDDIEINESCYVD